VASKHAIEGLTDSLAAQLAPLEVQVSVIEPGDFRSDVVKSMLARLAPELRAKAMPGPHESEYPEPTAVAVAVEQALFGRRPKRRYVVVTNDPRLVERTIRKQIEQLVQLNEGPPYTCDGAALIKMLDDALTTAGRELNEGLSPGDRSVTRSTGLGPRPIVLQSVVAASCRADR